MTPETKDDSELDREWVEENTWCDKCGKPDLGMHLIREYKESGRTFVEGACRVCGSTVRSEIIIRAAQPMEASSSDQWKPGNRVLFWARTTVIAMCAGAWIGAAFIFSVELIAVGAVAISVPVVFFGLFRLWQELGIADEIPPKVRRQLRQNMILFGPVTALQLLIYNRFPNSGFSGLRDLQE